MANLVQIKKYLQEKNIKFNVIDLESEVFTAEGVKSVGINLPAEASHQAIQEGLDEIVKTLIVRGNDDFVALALRGKDRLDFKKVRKLFGSKSELAKGDEVLKTCKVPVGAVCPILLNIPIYFDEKVMNLSRVSMGSGDLTKELEMDLPDLIKAVGKYKIMDLT